MNSRLKPVNKDKSYVMINGVKEQILQMPKTRDEDITISLGGKPEFSTTMSLSDFESVSGHYIIGLEPAGTYNQKDIIEQFQNMLVEKDFSLVGDSKWVLAGGQSNFTTEKNVHVEAEAYLSKRDNGYFLNVKRNAGYGTYREKTFEGALEIMPYLIDQAAAQIDVFTSTKVQILNKDVVDSERKYDERGYPIMKENESLQEYFDNQEMNAGVVVNNAGKYQAFYSYTTHMDLDDIQRTDPNFIQKDHNFNTLHYDTKSYKTIKGAERFLDQQGYDLDGRVLDVLDMNEFIEGFQTYNRHTGYLDSSCDKTIGMFSLDNGFGEIRNPVKDYDEHFGSKYTIEFNFVHEATGKEITRTCPVRGEGKHLDLGGPTSFMHEFISDASNFENLESFELDERTDRQKMDYHRDRVVIHTESLERLTGRLAETSDAESRERLAAAWEPTMGKLKSDIDCHIKAYKELNKTNERKVEL